MVHSVSVTAANRADISELPNLLRENDQVVFGDAGYASDEYKRGARTLGMVWRVQDKAKPKGSLGAALSGSQKKRNRTNSAIRARVEHLFRIVKRQFGYTKGALQRAGEEHRPGDGADRPGELVSFAPDVGDGINIPIASAARKWPTTMAPKTPSKSVV